ncbi:MAG: alpha/beta hydrolase [Leptospiraceae bacterium]|nr:alpha/beta hydrolase [Leptospiraceae bacterium]NUM40317.1 alpha/beta hydrolase [Leptospiraceae bacterium]
MFYFFFILTLLFNCKTTFELGKEISNRLSQPFDETKSIEVFFTTSRKTTDLNPSCSNSYFTTNFENKEKYGFCKVNVPIEHEIGAIDSNPSGDSQKFFKFEKYSSLNSENLFNQIKNDPFNEVLVFVHGFNVKFEEAVYRAAQIKFDVKFPGNVVVYSWPAGADEGFFNQLMIQGTYKNNFQNAIHSISGFKNFIKKLYSTQKKVHLIVHSMGHQVVLPGLSELADEMSEPFLHEVIFNAPDYDTNEFQKIVSKIVKSSKRVTVYCSPNDNALVASSKVNSGKRVGSCDKISGVEMINVNLVDSPVLGIGGLGHGYYSSRPILTDLFQILLGIPANKRLFIRKSNPNSTEDFILRK